MMLAALSEDRSGGMTRSGHVDAKARLGPQSDRANQKTASNNTSNPADRTQARHGIQVNDHFICRISRRNWVFQLADLRRVLMLPLDLLARRRPSAKRRTTAMFLAPWPAR